MVKNFFSISEEKHLILDTLDMLNDASSTCFNNKICFILHQVKNVNVDKAFISIIYTHEAQAKTKRLILLTHYISFTDLKCFHPEISHKGKHENGLMLIMFVIHVYKINLYNFDYKGFKKEWKIRKYTRSNGSVDSPDGLSRYHHLGKYNN